MSPDSPFSSRPVTFRKRKARILDRVADVAGGLDSKITTTTTKTKKRTREEVSSTVSGSNEREERLMDERKAKTYEILSLEPVDIVDEDGS